MTTPPAMNLKQRLLHLFTDHNDKLCPLVENFLLDAADPNCLGWADGGVLFEAYSFNDAKCTPYQVVSTFAKQVNSGLFNVQKDRPRDWIYVRDYKAAAEKLGGQEDAMQGPSTCTCLSGFSPALRGPFKLAAEVADLHGNMEGWPQMETMKQEKQAAEEALAGAVEDKRRVEKDLSAAQQSLTSLQAEKKKVDEDLAAAKQSLQEKLREKAPAPPSMVPAAPTAADKGKGPMVDPPEGKEEPAPDLVSSLRRRIATLNVRLAKAEAKVELYEKWEARVQVSVPVSQPMGTLGSTPTQQQIPPATENKDSTDSGSGESSGDAGQGPSNAPATPLVIQTRKQKAAADAGSAKAAKKAKGGKKQRKN